MPGPFSVPNVPRSACTMYVTSACCVPHGCRRGLHVLDCRSIEALFRLLVIPLLLVGRRNMQKRSTHRRRQALQTKHAQGEACRQSDKLNGQLSEILQKLRIQNTDFGLKTLCNVRSAGGIEPRAPAFKFNPARNTQGFALHVEGPCV